MVECRIIATVRAKVSKPNRQEWPWSDSLDAIVAAPNHHRVLLEKERVRVLEVRISPRQIIPVHTQRWPSVIYVLGSGDFIRRDEKGTAVLETRTMKSSPEPPAVSWSNPWPRHSVENLGESEIRSVIVELKD